MTKRPVSMDAGTLPSAAGQPVEGEPTPAQVTTYKMARVCLIEWADLYMAMLAEKRHDWSSQPEKVEWIQAEVARLQRQLQALKINDQATNARIAGDYEAFLKWARTERSS